MPLVKRFHEAPHLVTENARERNRIWSDDIHVEPAVPERGRHFEPDEARADDDGALLPSQGGDDRSAVGERSEHVHVVEVGPGNIETAAGGRP